MNGAAKKGISRLPNLGVDCFNVTDVGLIASKEHTEDSWEQFGYTICSQHNGQQWVIGDWLLLGESAGYLKRGRLHLACDKFGVGYDAAKNAAYICRKFPYQSRRQDLSFGHHQSVVGSKFAESLLEWAAANSKSVMDLRDERRRRDRNAGLAEIHSIPHRGTLWQFEVGDCAQLPFADNSFDLVFGSPPYESQRAYDELKFDLEGDEWVKWATDCFMECLRVSRGLVAWVVNGVTTDFVYSATPEKLMVSLQKRGVRLRRPGIYHRQGIPGSGGPDYFRNDHELIIAATKHGKLDWSDNTAMGPVSQKSSPRRNTNRSRNGDRANSIFIDPDVSNPGDVFRCLVGNGSLGWQGAHENEAPFPESLAERYIRTFCPPGGRVLDPFSGSGTTVAVAVKNGRTGVGVDIRKSQVNLGSKRLIELSKQLNLNVESN